MIYRLLILVLDQLVFEEVDLLFQFLDFGDGVSFVEIQILDDRFLG